MLMNLFIKMMFILVLCPVLLAAGVQTLTIDSQLGTSIEDCFDRISIGEQLPNDAIYRNVTELTTRECEQICKQDKQCQSYDYGVGAKGNATCELSNLSEKEIKEKSLLKRHPDYDVYARRFQCEQSPPSPIQQQFDDPESNAEKPEGSHRPIFRPDDEKFSDDYLVSTDVHPYGPGKPSPYRPDDYSNSKPDNDGPPSYGSHRPQDIPYKPERPQSNQSFNSRPGDELQFQGYGPEKPNKYYGNEKPNQHYVVRPTRRPYQIQDEYNPRPDPYSPNEPAPSLGYGQNDGHPSGPIGPPDRPYSSNRPYQKPSRPYEKPGSQYAGGYGQNQQNDHSIYLEIYDPPRPYKPVDKPFGFQGYGTYSSQNPYHQGTITEIGGYDHKRPVDSNRPDPIRRPQRPNGVDYENDDSGGYGLQRPHGSSYGHGGSHSSYGSSEVNYGSNQASYDSNLISHGSNQGGYGNSQGSAQSSQSIHSNSQSSYGNSQSNYGTSQNNYGNQGSYRPEDDTGYQRPQKPTPVKPSYGGQNIYGTNHESYESNQSSYSSSQSQYNSNHASGSHYANKPSNHQGDYPQKPQKPYGNPYGTAQSSYGNGQQSHDSSQGTYGSSQSSHETSQSSYGSSQSSYTNNQGSYGSSRPSYDNNQDSLGSSHGSYGSKPGPYGSDQGSYGSNEGSYGSSQGLYGIKPGSYVSSQGSYGSTQGSYDNNQGSYGSSQGSYGSKPGSYESGQGSYGNNGGSYGSGQGSFGSNQGSYGSSQGSYGSNQGSFGSAQSSYGSNQGSFGSTQGSYGSNQGSFGSAQGSYGSNQGSYGSAQGSYGSNQGSYGSSQGSYGSNDSNYGTTQEHYGGNHDSYGSNQGYVNNRPKPSYDSQNSGYTNKKPDSNSYGAASGSYGKPVNDSDYSVYPGVKPVYEYEADRPSGVPSYIAKPGGDIVASRPVVIGDYGEKPGYRQSGKGGSYPACFRRVLAGRRALRSHVRKAIPCERLENCRMECVSEIRFPCESFNYRLDRSFRGKGLCELMTKPIEAFDVRRDFVDDKDYDFYELDRNSLEPNCPDTLRGPGLLHSGYLSSKPDRLSDRIGDRDNNRWRDRNDWIYSRDRYQGHNRYDRRGGGNRYHEDRLYIPYQIGVGRSNDDHQNWGQYGGYYGGYDSYYKDTKDYYNAINHWQLKSGGDRYYGVRPLTNTIDHERHYVKPIEAFDYNSLGKSLPWTHKYGYGSWKRGRWNTSGLTWSDYEFNQRETEGRSEEVDTRDCSSRRRPGMSLGSGAIRRSLIAHNVVECEAACFAETEFKCVSYSYRYSNSHGSDNCFLSERPYRGLELSVDSGSDVYAMPQDQGCVSINYRPWVESECFWHVRSGAAVSDGSARAALTVAGLGACEAECLRANGFFCRGFSFRFDSPVIGDDLDNCILTSSPPTSLEVGRGLRPNPGHELYARGNYGRGCEPALYDDTQHRDSECYLQYDSASKLIGSAIRGQARVKDEKSCGVACTDAPFRCLSFSFNNNSPPDTDNCFLSEIRLFDLQKGVDYVHSLDDWLFAFDLFNGQCWRKVNGKGEYGTPPSELPHPISVSEPEFYSSGPGYLPEPPDPVYISGSGPSSLDTPPYKPIYTEPSGPPGFKPGYSIEPSGPVYLDDISGPSSKPVYHDKTGFKPDYKPSFIEHNRPGHISNSNYEKPGFATLNHKPYIDWDGPGHKPGDRPDKPIYYSDKPGFLSDEPGSRPLKPVYHGDREDSAIAVSWRHYTVSGFPCRTGTSCAQNHVAGHWACEPEGGEVGSWDYCCAPSHRCGYSEGFHKPWCYVGPTQDQWRPCSEKYYPYHQHSEPHPSQGNREHHSRPLIPWNDRPEYMERPQGPYLSEADRKYWDELYRNGPQAYYDKYGNPLPGYARVPTAERPYIKYSHNYRRPGGGQWVPVPPIQSDLDHTPYGLGAPRYWPVAYLHKGPPPNITYFRYNETSITTETPIADLPAQSRDLPTDIYVDKPNESDINKHKDEKKRNISDFNEDNLKLDVTTTIKTVTTDVTPVHEQEDNVKMNYSEVEATKPTKVNRNKLDAIDGIDDKLVDFSRSIEVFDIEDAKKHDKPCETLEAEERQIEEIGRLVASRRGGKLVMEKGSQKTLESKNIAVDKDLVDFNFGNHFSTNERRGIVQKVTKDEIEKERSTDGSLEVSETAFVRPPRVLGTTENIRKAIVNGKVFYDATIREQRDLLSNSTRRAKSLKPLEERGPSIINSTNNGKRKVIQTRNVNPVRRVRRVYKKRYNPEEVRRRLLEREKTLKVTSEMDRKL